MKLRGRKTRVLGDIKQEDRKPDLALINATSSTVNEPSTWGFNIKQEDTKNDNSLLQQGHVFEGRDYYYRCDMCKMKMPNLESVLKHRNSIHTINPLKKSMVKDINTEPNIHDPNFHCKPCKVKYTSGIKYRQHLRATHFMVLKTIHLVKKLQNNIVPDPDIPSLYCRSCDHTYSNKSSYKQHCRYAHGMASFKLVSRRSALGVITDSYCKQCDMRLSSMANYKSHLFSIHNLDWRLIQPKPKNIMPDVDDPKFYCRACESKLANKKSFKAHLMREHGIYQSAPKKTILEPDTDDPNNNCRACQTNYRTKISYRRHLRQVHHITLPPLRSNANLKSLPNPNDPHHYCSVCKKSWMKRAEYRSHCKRVHFMVLDHYSVSNPNATIDINHPAFYCAQCECSYSCRSGFKKHLRQIHSICD
ncbi:hypothetical protein HMPREF1544_01167 [Mucor circinelloides 1006PhL]|uniref:C2H2-type domain-containing protein n=1 Tax=Mucor circinelloides f. circinelloides (strain 1006PhL) TaxID=1220926 RepID=S2JPM2_MUCC1|nr:hypothetical protein HMPREF1544_01167 [Mucor circinelloides 1006PhL]